MWVYFFLNPLSCLKLFSVGAVIWTSQTVGTALTNTTFYTKNPDAGLGLLVVWVPTPWASNYTQQVGFLGMYVCGSHKRHQCVVTSVCDIGLNLALNHHTLNHSTLNLDRSWLTTGKLKYSRRLRTLNSSPGKKESFRPKDLCGVLATGLCFIVKVMNQYSIFQVYERERNGRLRI